MTRKANNFNQMFYYTSCISTSGNNFIKKLAMSNQNSPTV